MITREKVVEALEQVNDPELHMNLWFLGLIYEIHINGSHVKIVMTFTTPFCPYGPALVDTVKKSVEKAGAETAEVEIVTHPIWRPSEEVKAMLETM
ncbi:MAG TPA: metal-sulfur cluster assembly factor [archaeon]|nr:metal-sulfur cluster assembly factor [archaeon]